MNAACIPRISSFVFGFRARFECGRFAVNLIRRFCFPLPLAHCLIPAYGFAIFYLRSCLVCKAHSVESNHMPDSRNVSGSVPAYARFRVIPEFETHGSYPLCPRSALESLYRMVITPVMRGSYIPALGYHPSLWWCPQTSRIRIPPIPSLSVFPYRHRMIPELLAFAPRFAYRMRSSLPPSSRVLHRRLSPVRYWLSVVSLAVPA